MMSGKRAPRPRRSQDQGKKTSHVVSEPGSGTAEFFPDSSVGKPEASDLGSAPASATTTYTGSPRNPFSTVTCTDGSRNLSTTRLGSSWNPLSTTLHREGSGSWNPPTIPGQDGPRNLSTTPGGSPRNPLPPKEQNDDAGSTQPEIGNLGKTPETKIAVESLNPMHKEADNKLFKGADVGYAPVEVLCISQKEANTTIFQDENPDASPDEPQLGTTSNNKQIDFQDSGSVPNAVSDAGQISLEPTDDNTEPTPNEDPEPSLLQHFPTPKRSVEIRPKSQKERQKEIEKK